MDLARALAEVVGARQVLEDPELRAGYERDWTGRFGGPARLVVRPADTAQIAEVVRRCADAGAAIVPQGGNTGLVGASVPRGGGGVLSLARPPPLGGGPRGPGCPPPARSPPRWARSPPGRERRSPHCRSPAGPRVATLRWTSAPATRAPSAASWPATPAAPARCAMARRAGASSAWRRCSPTAASSHA